MIGSWGSWESDEAQKDKRYDCVIKRVTGVADTPQRTRQIGKGMESEDWPPQKTAFSARLQEAAYTLEEAQCHKEANKPELWSVSPHTLLLI